MKFPNAHLAVVEREKVVDYLLNPAHPDNGCKAAFFFSQGLDRDNWGGLAAALRKLAGEWTVASSLASSHGHKYVVEGRLETPAGRFPVVRTIWIKDTGSETPRLVSASPRR